MWTFDISVLRFISYLPLHNKAAYKNRMQCSLGTCWVCFKELVLIKRHCFCCCCTCPCQSQKRRDRGCRWSLPSLSLTWDVSLCCSCCWLSSSDLSARSVPATSQKWNWSSFGPQKWTYQYWNSTAFHRRSGQFHRTQRWPHMINIWSPVGKVWGIAGPASSAKRRYFSKIRRFVLIVAQCWRKLKIDRFLPRSIGNIAYMLEKERR